MKKQKEKKVDVVQPDGETEVPAKILAAAVRDIGAAARKLTSSGLNRRAIVLLLHDACVGVGKTQIDAILDAMETLERRYLR